MLHFFFSIAVSFSYLIFTLVWLKLLASFILVKFQFILKGFGFSFLRYLFEGLQGWNRFDCYDIFSFNTSDSSSFLLLSLVIPVSTSFKLSPLHIRPRSFVLIILASASCLLQISFGWQMAWWSLKIK